MSDFVTGNILTLLCSGREYFPALLAAIKSARSQIYLETYLYADDPAGRRIADALGAASQRGVKVHLLVDGFGAKDMSKSLRETLLSQRVELLVYRPNVSFVTLRRRRLRRLHRKIAVIDGVTAFVGGINIIDDEDVPHQIAPRFDYAVRVQGPLARQIFDSAAHLWRLVAWASLRHRPSPVISVEPIVQRGDQSAQFVIRDNFRHRDDIEIAYLDAIAAARDEIIIASAYFFPGLRFRRALRMAATRGVTVKLVLQGRVEYKLLHYASRALYGTFLAAGVEIHEYHKSFLHAKVAVIDNEWATVGSSNIDPFSLLLAREANLVIRDRKFASTLRDSLQTAMAAGAQRIIHEDWLGQSLWRRILIWLNYGIVRVLMGLIGYGAGA